MVNGACTLADSFASDLASNLPAASDARRFFEEWQACAVNSMTDCNATQGCSWDTDGNECAPSSDVEIQAMDWFDFTGCGILESADQSARCEAQTVCSAMAGCSEVQDDQFDVGSNGMCEMVTKCEYQGDMFLSACGSEFNFGISMLACSMQLAGDQQD
eukprot:6269985-Amphidinium_carterae.1